MALRIEHVDQQWAEDGAADQWEESRAEAVRILALLAAGDLVPDDYRPRELELRFANDALRTATRRGEVLWNAAAGELHDRYQLVPLRRYDIGQAEADRRMLIRIAEALGPDVCERWVNDDGQPAPDLAAEVRAIVARAST